MLTKITTMCKRKKNIILDIILIGLIIIITGWYIFERYRFSIIDEFGYWGVAAYAIGYDWSELLSYSSYYSFGYALVLIPILLLNKIGISMLVVYRISLIANVLFLVISYKLICAVAKAIFEDFEHSLIQGTAFFVVMYMGISSKTTIAWVEVWLFCVFWILTYSIYKFITNPKTSRAIIVAFLAVYIVSCHMRCIGVLIAVMMTMIYYFAVKKSEMDKMIVISFVASILLFAIVFVTLKNFCNTSIFSTSTNDYNDMPNQIERVQSVFSIDGIKDLVLSILGKLYYSSIATFGIVLVGTLYYFAYWWKNRNALPTIHLIGLFGLLSFLGELGICAVYLNYPIFRGETLGLYSMRDYFVYGRYQEFALGLVMLYGVYAMWKYNENMKVIVISFTTMVALTIICQYWINKVCDAIGESKIEIRWQMSPWLSFWNNGTVDSLLIRATFYSIVVSMMLLVFFGITYNKKIVLLSGILILLGVSEAIIGQIGTDTWVQTKSHKMKTVDSMSELINELDQSNNIVCLCNKDDPSLDFRIIQYQLGSKIIHVREWEDVKGKLDESVIYLANSRNSKLLGEITDYCDMWYDSGEIALFTTVNRKLNNEDKVALDNSQSKCITTEQCIDLTTIASDNSYMRYDAALYQNWGKEKQTYLTKAADFLLAEGTYSINTDIEICNIESTSMGRIDIGYVDSDDNIIIQQSLDLADYNFSKKKRQIITGTLNLNCATRPFVGVFTNGTSSVSVHSVCYTKKKNNIILGNDIEEWVLGVTNTEIFYIDSDDSSRTGHPYSDKLNMKYLPGSILAYKRAKPTGYYLVEKYDEENVYSADIKEYLTNMTLIDMNNGYMIYRN